MMALCGATVFLLPPLLWDFVGYGFTGCRRRGDVFEHVAGLAAQFPAQSIQSAEAHRSGFVGFEDRNVRQGQPDSYGQFSQADHLPGPIARVTGAGFCDPLGRPSHP